MINAVKHSSKLGNPMLNKVVGVKWDWIMQDKLNKTTRTSLHPAVDIEKKLKMMDVPNERTVAVEHATTKAISVWL